MNCRDLFEDTLTYTAPSHGDWGLVRIASLLPESHMIFFCPSACGRHGALGAVEQGFKDRVAYCCLDRQDIISGIDETVREGVRELMSRLSKEKRVVLLYVSCLDDLIGTDLDSLAQELAETYRNVIFRVGHMNPISLNGKTPPPVTTQDLMFNLLEPAEKDGGVNFLGNFVPTDANSELFRFLRSRGITAARHISQYSTFDGYQAMAKSSWNFVLMPSARLAAENLRRRLGTPYKFLTVTYDLNEIAEQYRQIGEFLGTAEFDCTPEFDCTAEFDFAPDIAEAKRKIEGAKAVLNGRPISISGGAVLKPFTLARSLLRYGFNVESVVTDEAMPFDENAISEVLDAGVKVIQPTHTNVIKFNDRNEDAVALGFEAAYIAGSKRIANLSNDHTMFGYHGVGKLMDLLADASENAYDLQELLKEYGVVL